MKKRKKLALDLALEEVSRKVRPTAKDYTDLPSTGNPTFAICGCCEGGFKELNVK